MGTKILQHSLIKPILWKLFICSKTAAHIVGITWDEKKMMYLCHPADSKELATLWCSLSFFWAEIRNVRGTSEERFNSFSNTNHCTLLVSLVAYNLPPYMCMKNHALWCLYSFQAQAAKKWYWCVLQRWIEGSLDNWIDKLKTY